MSGTHARHQLDEHIHAPTRLSIVAALNSVDQSDFATLRDTVELSDSALSKQASALEAVGYVKIKKGFVGKRPRTWLSLTPQGRTAFEQHLAALRRIASGE